MTFHPNNYLHHSAYDVNYHDNTDYRKRSYRRNLLIEKQTTWSGKKESIKRVSLAGKRKPSTRKRSILCKPAKNEEFPTLVKKRPVINYFHRRYFLITTYTFRLMT